MLWNRIRSQMNQLESLVRQVLGYQPPPTREETLHLVRDRFNLHKMIVLVTAPGKVNFIRQVSTMLALQCFKRM